MHRLVFVLALLVACHSPEPVRPSNDALEPKLTDAPISVASLITFVKERFPEAVAKGTFTLDFGDGRVDDEIIEELTILGITTTTALAAAVPRDYQDKGVAAVEGTVEGKTTIAGLMRDLMIIHDTRGYLERAWDHKWVADGPQDFAAPQAYGVDFAIFEELGVFE